MVGTPSETRDDRVRYFIRSTRATHAPLWYCGSGGFTDARENRWGYKTRGAAEHAIKQMGLTHVEILAEDVS